MICSNCNNAIAENERFCKFCGHDFEKKIKSCLNINCFKKDIPQKAHFCPECGTKFNNMKSKKEIQYTHFTHKESIWNKFTYWLEMEFWWNFKYRGWKYLVAYIIIIGTALAIIINVPSSSKFVVPASIALLFWAHELVD